ncbi:MAG: hypothetical protein B6U76_08580 [Desulfurococcales archaeon ex4484_217_2]|nr:MAG: hypothetical protein B6U76_08580 [Desulfurococcales archaeon ex4484_217_2]
MRLGLGLARRLIPISEELLDELVRVASSGGSSLRVIVEDILKDAIKVFRLRGSLKSVVREIEVLEEVKRLGGYIVPARVFYSILDRLGDDDFEKVVSEMKKTSSWYGSVLKAKFGRGGVNLLGDVLQTYFWDSKVSIRNSGNKVSIILSSPHQTDKATYVTRESLLALLKSMGLNVLNVESSEGVIVVEAEY